MYNEGQGVEKDIVFAYAWWNIAALNGQAEAQKNKAISGKINGIVTVSAGLVFSEDMIKKNPKLLNKKD